MPLQPTANNRKRLSIMLLTVLLTTPFSFLTAQRDRSVSSTKKIFIELGALATRSGPYNSAGNSSGRFARPGLNSGALIGAGLVNQVSQKFAVQTALQISNLSPYIFYGTTVKDMSWYSSIDHPKRRWPAVSNVASATLQVSAERMTQLKHTVLIAGAGLAAHYVFNRNAADGTEPQLLARSTLTTNEIKELKFTQSVNRFAADVPIYLALSDFRQSLKRLRVTLQYNIALRPRSDGSFVFDKDQGQATGRYRFIGNTAAFKVGWYLTK